MLIHLLKHISIAKNLSAQCRAKIKKRRKMTVLTYMGYDVWWQVLPKNGSWHSNLSMLPCVRSLMAHLYGKVEGT